MIQIKNTVSFSLDSVGMNLIVFPGQEDIDTIFKSNFLLSFALSQESPGMRKAIKAWWSTYSNKIWLILMLRETGFPCECIGKMIRTSNYTVWAYGIWSQFIRAGRRSIKFKYYHFIEKKTEAQWGKITCKNTACWLFLSQNQNLRIPRSSPCTSYLKISCTNCK